MSFKKNSQPKPTVNDLCDREGIPHPQPEHPFHPVRKWRFDFAWIEEKVAIERQGGIFIGGKHARGFGLVKDYEKYNEAQTLGWIVLQFSSRQMEEGAFLAILRRALIARGRLLPARHVPAADDFQDDYQPDELNG